MKAEKCSFSVDFGPISVPQQVQLGIHFRVEVAESPASGSSVPLRLTIAARSLVVFPTKSGQFSLEGSKRIRCVIADDHTLLRDGVRRLLEDAPDFAVVGEAGDASETLKQVIEHR